MARESELQRGQKDSLDAIEARSPQANKGANQLERPGDVGMLRSAEDVPSGRAKGSIFRRLLPFLGPAFVASVAYVDPGNFATNIQGGARYGYMLLWVIVMSNVMAMVIQSLSAKLGIATGKNLAELCRENFPRHVVWVMWLLSEAVAMATDLAEFLGAALGFYLLFGIPLLVAAALTGIITFIILGLERYGVRPVEIVIGLLVGIIAVSYLLETVIVQPDWTQVFHGAITPRFEGTDSVLLAVGILGATVMPHVIFLHSALVQNRIPTPTSEQARRLFRLEVIDVILAMGIAGMINGAMLIMAAATFHLTGQAHIASIEEAHQTLEPLLGGLSSTVFAVSLLASGLSSSTVGTMAGQVVMQGYLHRHIPLWLRRSITMIPAFVVIAVGLDPTQTLVVSQVVLSFGIPVALIPLVLFTARRRLMGELTNRSITTIIGWTIAVLIIALNGFLLWQTLVGA